MRLLRPYLAILGLRGAWRFSLAAWLGRLVRSTASIGAILLVTGRGADYLTAGTTSGAIVVGAALLGPAWSRLADRVGQTRALTFALPALAASAALLIATVEGGAPTPVWIGAAFLVGATSFDAGAFARARWVRLLDDRERRHSAFALEAAGDEFTFVIGPPIVTALAAAISPPLGFATGVALSLVGGIALLAQRGTAPTVPPRAERHRSAWLPLSVAAVLPIHLGIGLAFGSIDLTAVGIATAAGSSALAGILLALFAVGSVSSGLLWGALAGGWSVRRCLLVAGLMYGVLVAPFGLVGDPIGFAVVSIIAGFATAPALITAATVIERSADAHGMTAALSWPTVALSIGVTVGASVAGAVIDGGGSYGGLLVTSIGAGIALVAALLNAAFRRER